MFLLCHYYLPLEKDVAVHLKKLESPSPNDALCQVWLKLAPLFWRRFLNYVSAILLFRYLPLKDGMALHLNKNKFPTTNDALCQVWLKLAYCFCRRRFLFTYHLPMEKGFALHLNKLESPSTNDVLFQIWNSPSGSGEEDENVKSL